MSDQTLPAIQAGEIAPFYVGITNTEKLYSFETQVGRPAVLLLVGQLDAPTTAPLIQSFEQYNDRFQAADADVVVLANDTHWAALDYTMKHPTRLAIACEAEAFVSACGLTVPPPAILVMDASRVIVACIAESEPAKAAEAALAHLAALPREAARDIAVQAPVLLLRNVIGRDFCRELIELFEKGGHFDSGFMSIDDKGAPKLKIDHSFKRRSDHFIQTDHPMNARLMDVVIGRVAPEIKRAFHIDVVHCERFLISCYDETGGYFRRHRDDTGAANAHRQFAITLNLNAEEYEGGHLTFPEYGPHRYRPGTGEAAIFSGSMLHEALPVVRGKRYALLGFLHSAEADARRRVYLEKAAGA